MADRIVALRTSRPDIDALSDPRPECIAHLQAATVASRMSYGELARAVGRLCGASWVDEHMVERWVRGEDDPPMSVGCAILRICGWPMSSLLGLPVPGRMAR